MKKLFVSAGLVALGAAGLQSAIADDAATPKDWNVSGTLRGFYDDNYNITGNAKGSAGAEVSPQVSYHLPLQQTDMGIRYTYGLYYYQDRNDAGVNAFDQTHQADLWLDHAINERWDVKFTDTFAVGQEPELLTPSQAAAQAAPYRINGDNISNHGSVALTTEWTRLFSTVVTYNNGFYDYDNSGATLQQITGPLTVYGQGTVLSPRYGLLGWYKMANGAASGGGSLAGILDRVEESLSFDLKWTVQPETVLFVGYQFSLVNYTGNEPISAVDYSSGNPPYAPLGGGYYTPAHPQTLVYRSSDRDSLSHYIYAGIEHQFSPNLNGTAKAGASITDNYNDPLNPTISVSPEADISAQYTYSPGCYLQAGFTQEIAPTDQVAPDGSGNITLYAEDSVGYIDLKHKITPNLTGTAIGRVQYSTYQGGAASSDDETDYSLGISLDYQINRHLSVDAGYNYDNVVTSLTGYGYSRNRVFLGLTANY